ncbi:unnamed protein product [Durusdinium trenchii]|uniref:Uncharacterized protein n=1 Tax=Durusdinium trenchii TaxID=1381693 RepID=A0ABP0RLS9_9DINO
MSVVRLDEDDLDEEDLAILREVASKGYYHNRPKNSTNAPAPQRLTEDKAPVDPAAAAVPGLSAAGTAGRRSCFDAFQAKWDRFDNDAFLEELGEHSSLDANDATTRPGGAPTVVAKPPAQHLRRYAAEFKILLLGERGVGKTAFLLRHTTGEFAVAPPAGGAPLALRFMTNCGELCFQAPAENGWSRQHAVEHTGQLVLRILSCAVSCSVGGFSSLAAV